VATCNLLLIDSLLNFKVPHANTQIVNLKTNSYASLDMTTLIE
jgi:hypothetical protein